MFHNCSAVTITWSPSFTDTSDAVVPLSPVTLAPATNVLSYFTVTGFKPSTNITFVAEAQAGEILPGDVDTSSSFPIDTSRAIHIGAGVASCYSCEGEINNVAIGLIVISCVFVAIIGVIIVAMVIKTNAIRLLKDRHRKLRQEFTVVAGKITNRRYSSVYEEP